MLRRYSYEGTPAELTTIVALADERDRIAGLIDACVDTDNPLEGAAVLCEMRALQHTPGTSLEWAWSAVAEMMRHHLVDLHAPPLQIWESARAV